MNETYVGILMFVNNKKLSPEIKRVCFYVFGI